MFWHILKLSSTMYPPFEHSLLSSFSWSRRRKESLPKSLQAFKVVAVRTFGLVNLVFFLVKLVFRVHPSIDKTVGFNWARYTKHTAIRPGFETVS